MQMLRGHELLECVVKVVVQEQDVVVQEQDARSGKAKLEQGQSKQGGFVQRTGSGSSLCGEVTSLYQAQGRRMVSVAGR